MANRTHITLIGNLDAFKMRVQKHINQKVVEAIRTTGEEALTAVKQAVPVDTGALRDSIELDVSKGGHYAKIRANYNRGGNHAHLVEFGTEHMSARPFLYVTVDRFRPQLIQKIKTALRK